MTQSTSSSSNSVSIFRRLPGPYNHVVIEQPIGRSPTSQVYFAESKQLPDEILVVEFLYNEAIPSTARTISATGRTVLDLQRWAKEGLPKTAIVSVLPIAIPAPYSQIRLLRPVGWGAMGEVWRAESSDFPGIPLAVKFFHHLRADPDPKAVEASVEEVRFGLLVTSPHIVRVFHMLQIPGRSAQGWAPLGMVMRYHQPTLHRVLEDLVERSYPLPTHLAEKWATQLKSAIKTLHDEYGLVHRDIKPTNILMHFPLGKLYTGPESLLSASVVLGDLGTACRIGKVPTFVLRQDGWKHPGLYGSSDDLPRPADDSIPTADPSEDNYSLGKILEKFEQVIDNPSKTLNHMREDVTWE